MKKRIVTKQKVEFYENCRRCGYEVVGSNEKHFRMNMDQHKGSPRCERIKQKSGDKKK